jgi:hypothetical protein
MCFEGVSARPYISGRIGLHESYSDTSLEILLEYNLSEEFSSRVAESTRLILAKDGFGGELGALDRWTDECRKDTKI